MSLGQKSQSVLLSPCRLIPAYFSPSLLLIIDFPYYPKKVRNVKGRIYIVNKVVFLYNEMNITGFSRFE